MLFYIFQGLLLTGLCGRCFIFLCKLDSVVRCCIFNFVLQKLTGLCGESLVSTFFLPVPLSPPLLPACLLIFTPFSPPILHNFWLMVAPVHVHFIRYIRVQVLACDTEHGCQLKAETDSGHAHCRRPVFQCNTYRSSASESHTYGQLSTISRSSTWTLDKGWVGGGVEG